MLNRINNLIDGTTMYKVLIYGLASLAGYSLVGTAFFDIGFKTSEAILSLLVLLVSGVVANTVIAKLLKIHPHHESAVITALILYFLYTPANTFLDLVVLAAISAIASLSKYLFTKNQTHIFNPAAFAAFFGALILAFPASWWVGSTYMLPATVTLSIIIFRKQRKFTFGLIYLVVSIAVIYLFMGSFFNSIPEFFIQVFQMWPLLFFASVMLTEPFTLPPKKHQEYFYAALAALIANVPFNVFVFGNNPETALLTCNLVSIFLYNRARYLLKFEGMKELSNGIFELSFSPNRKIKFEAGQYLEVMLDHKQSDSRGTRRYFTIASSPNESEIKFGIRIRKDGSTFKDTLQNLQVGQYIYAEQVRGDFVLDKKPRNYIFIAGGIGVTPYISILRTTIFNRGKLNAALIYLNENPADFVYQDVLDESNSLGVTTYKLNRSGFTQEKFKEISAKYPDALVYISGPSMMVQSCKEFLIKAGVKPLNIRTDYFNGL